MVDSVQGLWRPTEVMERVLDGTWAEVVDGMALIEPTSIVFSGTSAAITGLGSVEFSAVTSLSLNGVFSSLFDNYMVSVISHDPSTNGVDLNMRLRLSGTDNSTASSYVRQQISATGISVSGARSTSNLAFILQYGKNTLRNGIACFLYGPSLAQPTAARCVNVDSDSNVRLMDHAFTHNQSTAYDGFTFFTGATGVTGRVAVYGMVK